jgi:hypothetical protein
LPQARLPRAAHSGGAGVIRTRRQAQSFSIKVSPVSTLGEAYEIATGQSLRPAR